MYPLSRPARKAMSSMKLKKRVYTLDLADTDLTVYLHNPSIENFDAYLKKMQGFTKLGDIFLNVKSAGADLTIPDEVKQDIYDLIGMVTDVVEDDKRRPISEDEIKQLSMWDCVSIVKAMDVMANAAINPTPAAEKPPMPEPPTSVS